MSRGIIQGAKSIGMFSKVPLSGTLPPTGAEDPNEIWQWMLGEIDNLKQVVAGKADANKIRTLISYSDEAILLQAKEIALRGNVTILDVENNRNGTGAADLPPSMTRIRGGVIQTEAIISSNWGPAAGTSIDLDDGIIKMGGSAAPKFHYEAGNLSITGELKAGSIIAGAVTVAGVPLSTISGNAQAGVNIQQALEANGSVILTGQIVPTNTGGLKVGTISWNTSTGALTGGTGVAITEFGIIGASSGSATFTINASTGAATFAGALSAATGTFAGNLSAAGGTFSGSISAASGTFTGGINTSGVIVGTGSTNLFGVRAAIHGVPSDTSRVGVYGETASGVGVQGFSGGVGGFGGSFTNSAGGVALNVATGLSTNATAIQITSGKITKSRVNGHLVKVYDPSTHALLNTFEYSFE